jgi:hypothetical protein
VSLTPDPSPFTASAEPEPQPQAPQFRWYHKVGAVLLAIFCFELGVFLMVFPWLEFWEENYFATYNHTLQQLWMNPFFRGAVSGLGLVNIFVSFIEIIRLRRFSAD